MMFRTQNLNDLPGGRTGSILRHGRAWLFSYERGLRFEWNFRPKVELAATISQGYGAGTTVALHFFGCDLYIGLSGLIYPAIKTGLSFEWERTPVLRIDIASSLWEWNRSDPWWRKGKRFDFADILFGRTEYSKRVIEQRDAFVPMPEGSYPARVEIEEATWKRPRWPFATRRIGASVSVDGGVPMAGKGENSWDCGDDAVFSMGSDAKTVEDAIGRFVTSVMRDRRRNGEASFLVGVPPVIAPKKPVEATP